MDNPQPNTTPTELRPDTGAPTWAIESDITVYTVEGLRDQLLEKLAHADTLTLDLGMVNACDCAGLQLLCATRKSAQSANKQLHILNSSPAILSAAEGIGLNCKDFSDPEQPAQQETPQHE